MRGANLGAAAALAVLAAALPAYAQAPAPGQGSTLAPGAPPPGFFQPPGQPSQPAPAAPAAPQAAAAPAPGAPGVPFPGMVNGQQQARGSQGSGPAIPLASQPMSMDQQRVDATLRNMDRQVADRLAGLRVGEGQLSAPDTAAYQSELRELAAEERQIRLLQRRQARADLAMKLWATTFDARAEDEAARAANAGTPRADARAAAEAEKAAAEAEKAAQDAREAREAARVAASGEDLMPKVFSISGGAGNLRAVVLVPMEGEITVTVGDVLPGNRRVQRITPRGVYVHDPKTGRTGPLGFGDSVPMTRPAPPPVQAQPVQTQAPQAFGARPGFPAGR